MERRSFIHHAGIAGILAAGAPPAFAQAAYTVRWRLASTFPRSLDAIFGGAEAIARRVAAATGNRFRIEVFAAGEVAAPFDVVDAVGSGRVQCAHCVPNHLFDREPTFAFAGAVPFGMNTRQQNAWMYHGGGLALMREFMQDYNIRNIPAGNAGAQMGGFFRQEIHAAGDLKGLKIRTGAFAGAVLRKLGVEPQQLAGAEIYASLEQGTLDAAEWMGPHDDEKLGLGKVARYYYYPGWWEGGPEFDLFINTKAWADLPADYQAVLEAACSQASLDMVAVYDVLNPAALRRLVAGGVQLRPFPREVLLASWKAANDVFEETAAANASFRKVYEPWKRFRDEQILWFRVAEQKFNNFMAMAAQQGNGTPRS